MRVFEEEEEEVQLISVRLTDERVLSETIDLATSCLKRTLVRCPTNSSDVAGRHFSVGH